MPAVPVGDGVTSLVESAVFTHFQRCLGTPDTRWHYADGRLHVLHFADRPTTDSVTFVTLGLSEIVLQQESGPVRQELLFACQREFDDLPIPEGLACIAGERAFAGRPFYDPEIIGPVGWLGRRVGVRWFMVSNPQYHGSDLGIPIHVDPPAGVVWLIPLTEAEADFAQSQGADVLARSFGRFNPDLLDLKRKSVPLEAEPPQQSTKPP